MVGAMGRVDRRPGAGRSARVEALRERMGASCPRSSPTPRAAKVKALRCGNDNPCRDVAPPERDTSKREPYLDPDELLKLAGGEADLDARRTYAVTVYLYLRAGSCSGYDRKHRKKPRDSLFGVRDSKPGRRCRPRARTPETRP
jgi:hypothetical protein